jgi:hypothetical protein
LNISENSETMWEPPVGDPVRTAVPNHTDGLRTTATATLPHPRLSHRHCSCPQLLPPPPTASCTYNRSTPSWSAPRSSSSARSTAPASPQTLPCSTSLSHCEQPLWSLSDPLDIAPSFALMPWVPSTTLPVPSTVPPCPHPRSPLLGLCHRGTPCSGEPLPPRTPQTSSLSQRPPLTTTVAELITGHCRICTRSTAPAPSSAVAAFASAPPPRRHGSEVPYLSTLGQKAKWAGNPWLGRPGWRRRQSPLLHRHFSFILWKIQIHF